MCMGVASGAQRQNTSSLRVSVWRARKLKSTGCECARFRRCVPPESPRTEFRQCRCVPHMPTNEHRTRTNPCTEAKHRKPNDGFIGVQNIEQQKKIFYFVLGFSSGQQRRTLANRPRHDREKLDKCLMRQTKRTIFDSLSQRISGLLLFFWVPRVISIDEDVGINERDHGRKSRFESSLVRSFGDFLVEFRLRERVDAPLLRRRV